MGVAKFLICLQEKSKTDPEVLVFRSLAGKMASTKQSKLWAVPLYVLR